MINLSLFDLTIVGLTIFFSALLTLTIHVSLTKKIFIAALRTTVQLFLVGVVLTTVFNNQNVYITLAIALVMLLLAGNEVHSRQQNRIKGIEGYLVGLSSISVSTFSLALFSLFFVVKPTPWHDPRYFIPILGMLLGNTMNGISISLDRLHQFAIKDRKIIEARLLMGATKEEAISKQKKESLQAGLIPIINAMSAAGIISLPGMMTGQILGGTAPAEAVKYQIMIMFLIASSVIIGSYIGINLSIAKIFDDRSRLRKDILVRLSK